MSYFYVAKKSQNGLCIYYINNPIDKVHPLRPRMEFGRLEMDWDLFVKIGGDGHSAERIVDILQL